jgi:hypothetical protein
MLRKRSCTRTRSCPPKRPFHELRCARSRAFSRTPAIPVLDVVDQTLPLAQPELLNTESKIAEVQVTRDVEPQMETVLAPEPLTQQTLF